jgi:hypothetical protein
LIVQDLKAGLNQVKKILQFDLLEQKDVPTVVFALPVNNQSSIVLIKDNPISMDSSTVWYGADGGGDEWSDPDSTVWYGADGGAPNGGVYDDKWRFIPIYLP